MSIKNNASNHLLVYGTLLNAGNAYAHLLQNNSLPAGDGWFPGRLYNLGEYPGAVYDQHASTKVYGHIRLVTNIDSVLSTLDEYEGFGPDEEQPNLFVRELVEVVTNDGDKITCWVYLFNRSVAGCRMIEGGRYR